MPGCDMIVSLMKLPENKVAEGIKIKRAFGGEKDKVLDFIKENFTIAWANEAERAILQDISKCFIATENGKILGFACYDASARGFFGPTGVTEAARGKGVGSALLLKTLESMREYGYAYAIIGWVDDAEMFYRKVVGAEFIKGGEPENSIYCNMIEM